MARAIWNGAISFGLVNVPVQLFSATEQKDIRFHQLQEGTGQRIRYKRVAEESGREVDYDDIVKGYEVDDGQYVVVTSEELEAAAPEQSRTIAIEEFVDLAEIDPIHFEKTYYLGPKGDAGADRAYALLRRAMADANRIAIGRFVMRTKEYLAAIRPKGDILVLETMFFPDEIREPQAVIDNWPGKAEPAPKELEAARQLLDSLAEPWEPERWRDTHRERVLELIERKAEGEEIVVDAGRPEEAEVVDLMAALEASLASTRGHRRKAEEAERRAYGRDGSGDGTDWSAMSREELYEEAQRRDVAGRSKMTKDELAAALEKAS